MTYPRMKDPKIDLPPITNSTYPNSSDFVLGVVLFETGEYSIEHIRLVKVKTSQFWINYNNIISESPYLTFKRHSKNYSVEYHTKNYNSYKVLSWTFPEDISLTI